MSIAQAPGAVDVIDTVTLERVKSIPVKGAVHNTYVTPDGKYVVAGSIAGKNITVIDAKTEQLVWALDFDLGSAPSGIRTQSRWIDKTDFRSALRPQWVCGRGFCDAQGDRLGSRCR